MDIIPAIDIINGKCVRLTKGNYSQCKIYAEDPLEVALRFEAAGCKRLHLVDLDGAKSSGVIHEAVLAKICRQTGLIVDFGGGVKSDTDIRKVFDAGAAFVCIGSLAQSAREQVCQWLARYGGERLIIGADVWNQKVCINGWKKVTDTTVYQLVDFYEGQLKYLMCTDITKDGTLEGASLGLYRELRKKYPVLKLIASGGVSRIADLAGLEELGMYGAIVGKAIYENRIKLEELFGN